MLKSNYKLENKVISRSFSITIIEGKYYLITAKKSNFGTV
jgi:hypothetical protein